MASTPSPPPDRGRTWDRREFIRTSAAATALVSTSAPLAPTADAPEALARKLCGTLTAEQRKFVHLPFDSPHRQRVDNNWRITKAHAEILDRDQQAMVEEIVRGLHSPEWADRVIAQIHEDNGGDRRGGFGLCSAAFFGDPATEKFEFVFTGRHVTRRCGGPDAARTAFGGPVFYGHQGQRFHEKPDHPGNVYWYQALRANEVFAALDGAQRKRALRDDPRAERGTRTVALRGKAQGLGGIPVGELSGDQQRLVQRVIADVLAPFRAADRQRTLEMIRAGGLADLHLAFYRNLDVGKDGVWDVWQLESPDLVWYFRGHPHVHVWVHVRAPRLASRPRRKVI